MAASSTDKLSMTANGGIPVTATVQAIRVPGATTLTVDTQQYWPILSGVKFSTVEIDSNNNQIDGTQIDWEGVSNGSNTLNNIVRQGGAADTGNTIGNKVIFNITAQWGEDLIEALLTSHSQSGTLLPSAVQTAIGTGGIVAANLAAGAVTNAAVAAGISTAKLSNPYEFSVQLNTSYTTTVATPTKLPLETKNFDIGTNYDNTTNYRFTAPVAGKYQFDASFLCAVSQGRIFLSFYKNGTEYRRGNDNNAGGYGAHNSLFTQLAANDYIEIFYFTTGATAVTTGTVTQFNGYLVSLT